MLKRVKLSEYALLRKIYNVKVITASDTEAVIFYTEIK